uniref:Uncharacterized protein n=1 Tax=Physcomitrium patens TaxID=3218 RepID=A0A7I3Z3E7_PHYPA
MEFFAPAKGAPSSFAAGLEAPSASDIAPGSGLQLYDDWGGHSQHAGGAQRSPPEGGSGNTISIGLLDAVGASPSSGGSNDERFGPIWGVGW